MSPDYFVIPLIMNQATSIINTMKTGVIIFDFAVLLFFLFMFYTADINYIRRYYILWNDNKKSSIVISTNNENRTIRFRAIMHYITTKNNNIYRIREDAEFDWEDVEKRSQYLIDQLKDFKLDENIYGKIRREEREKNRNPDTNNIITIEYDTITVFSSKHNLTYLQKWVDDRLKEYKEHLKRTSNDKQLFITVAGDSNDDSKKKKNKNKNNNGLLVESVEWESSITFKNSYFQNMDEIIKKIDFFLNNKKWYMERGVPYNLGILLYGEPGCGKTRFIKQLMNYTGRHGIDIKLNDSMDFTDLQNVIYKEELDETHIIPQNQRILIFEDIDALGDVVKDRDLKKSESNLSINESHFVSVGNGDFNNNGNNINNGNNNTLSNFFKISNQTKQNNNLSYLLNMLDGIHECSGRILIMTTNKLDVLDKALIRPGRIDIKINFQKCSLYDISRMIKSFWNIDIPSDTILPEIERKYTNAEIINIFRSTDDFESIRSEFC